MFALIPVFPLIGVLLNGLLGVKYFSKRTIHGIAVGMVGLSFAASAVSSSQATWASTPRSSEVSAVHPSAASMRSVAPPVRSASPADGERGHRRRAGGLGPPDRGPVDDEYADSRHRGDGRSSRATRRGGL